MKALIESSDQIGVMGHVIADFPSPKTARELIDAMVGAGVRIIEIQIPFSEPMADGPTFMVANHAAIEAGVTFADAIKLMGEVSAKYPQVPFVFMSYANIIFKQGYEQFVVKAIEAGARGAIVPDLPPEMAVEYIDACKKYDFANVVVIPPNIDDERLGVLCQSASGLIYAVARAGVTGTKSTFGSELEMLIGRIRKRSELPVAVGFGIQDRADVLSLQGKADLAVIGSQGLRAFEHGGIEGAQKFWQSVT